MLRALKDPHTPTPTPTPTPTIHGILSSHPAALLATLRAFGSGIENLDLETVRRRARAVMDGSPIDYVRGAKLVGRLFEQEDGDGSGSGDGSGNASVCCADTAFWVDHAEPLAALDVVRERGVAWPFGELREGCEFLVLVES
ncbi:hypothetical protein EKO04_006256 [Ascochyta lentis]|uniref:Uncharacterized protein n=1 Tax=Ascochyta lentis TaxID=205686 RepID=A0A8H7J3D6_9PLEO|nr:hypothetical protein EKO04_006256 [Ascochyta lentis]